MPTPTEFKPTEPQKAIYATLCQRVLFHSGVGSGKSHCIGSISADFVINNPEIVGFIGANTYQQLSKSTLLRTFKVWEDYFGWVKDVHYVVDIIPPEGFGRFGPQLKSYEGTICFNNGAMIFTSSLDNYKVIDGTEFGWALLDETKDTKEEAVKEVIVARLRQPGMYVTPNGTISKHDAPDNKGYAPLYIFTSPAKVDWLVKWFDMDKEFEKIASVIFTPGKFYHNETNDRCVVISSTYWNQHNLKKGYIEDLLNDYRHNTNMTDMLIYGSPLAKTGNEFYSCFNRLTHVQSCEPYLGPPIHLSFDFNVNPYITLLCYQILQGDKGEIEVNQFDEICLESPRNNTEALCNEFDARWGNKTSSVFYYGDYSGKNGNTLTSEYKHNYEVVEKYLRKYLHNHSDRVIVNPFVVKRRDFMNKMFFGSLKIVHRIDPRCEKTIDDYEFVKEAADGGKLKKKITKNGITFEERGHCSDAGDYFFCSAFNPEFES